MYPAAPVAGGARFLLRPVRGPLAPERMLLARLLFARGEYRESIAAASVFDHAEPVLFRPYLPASLSLRYQAVLELSDDVAAEHYRDRLQRLHRAELVTDERQRR